MPDDAENNYFAVSSSFGFSFLVMSGKVEFIFGRGAYLLHFFDDQNLYQIQFTSTWLIPGHLASNAKHLIIS